MYNNKFFITFLILFSNFLFSQRFLWEEDKKLNWDQFRSKSNSLRSPDVVAYTHCGWEYSVITSSNPKILPKIEIQTIFNEDKSWKDVKRINDYVLLHEQKHFDIAEVFARKLRKEVSEKIMSTADYKKYFQGIYARISKDYKTYQTLYDKETKNGMNKEIQAIYNISISTELEQLSNYKKL